MPFKPPIPPAKIYPNANPLAIEMLEARYLASYHPYRMAPSEMLQVSKGVGKGGSAGRKEGIV